jgi:pimeloyl-ACP methyl ester carboxylesterase
VARRIGLAGCVDSVVSQVEPSFAVDVTLVGHSWGGYVIAAAAGVPAEGPGVLERLRARGGPGSIAVSDPSRAARLAAPGDR